MTDLTLLSEVHEAYTATSTVADEIGIKCAIADAAIRDLNLLKADVSNAYIKGRRRDRPVGYMYMPNTCQEYDDDGSKLRRAI